MNSRLQNLLVSGIIAVALANTAFGIQWSYVYEADRYPLSAGSIVDSACVEKGAFTIAGGIATNSHLNQNATLTVDDTNSFGASNYVADGVLWSGTEPITVEMKLKLEKYYPGEGVVFLDVTNSVTGWGYRWWINYDPNEQEGIIYGHRVVGQPNEPSDELMINTLDWVTVRVTVPADAMGWATLQAKDSAGNFGTDPNTGLTACRGYAYPASTTMLLWGDMISTESQGSVIYDYVRWYVGSEYNFSTTIDEPQACPCGRWGYLKTDYAKDCNVDLKDFAYLAQDWVKCTDPMDPTCYNLYSLDPEGGPYLWQYMYEADTLPGTTGCITNASHAGIGQFDGTAAVTASDGVVSIVGGILDIDDTIAGGNHYCQIISSSGLWNGRGSTVELKMSLNDWVSSNNVQVLVVGDGVNTYEWWVTPTAINSVSGNINIDMTQMQTIRIAFPSSGSAILYTGGSSCIGYERSSTLNGLQFGDLFSSFSGHLQYDYVRWLTTGAYNFDTQINVP